jgi:WD40 repeat protein/mono/diheme cytochrome c family protein
MRRSHFCFCLLCALVGAALAVLLLAPTAARAQAKPVSFIQEVAPILKESCWGCHGAKNPKGKLDMTKYASFRKGGTKDDPIVPGKPDDSYIINVLTKTGKGRMPPKDSGDELPKPQIDLIARWIAEGGKLDAEVKPDADLLKELRIRWVSPLAPAVYPFPVTITALAFTPDGKKLVVSGHHELTIWDVESGKLEKRIRTRARRATAMVFLADGKLVVSGGRPGEEGELRVYNINGGTPKVENGVAYLDGVTDPAVLVKQLITPLDADDEILCLAVSADGKKLAAGGCDRLVHVWDISAGITAAKLEQSIENHADWVFSVAFTPDGKHLLTSSRDKTAKVWDLTTKESVITFPDHQNTVYGVLSSKDSKFGISCGEDAQVRVFNATGEGKQVRASGGHGRGVFKVVAHPKQPLLVTCSADTTVRIWNADNGAAVRALNGHTDWVFAVAVSPDGERIASGAFNGEVRLWKTADGALIRAFPASPGLVPPAPPMPPMPPKK